jgi:hypothetical protein
MAHWFPICLALASASCSSLAPRPSPASAEPAVFAQAGGAAVAPALAATRDDALRYGIEVQAYPAGLIPGVHLQWPLSPRDQLTLRLAANLTDREDYGEQDDEEGHGFGGGVGYRRYWAEQRAGWLYGARLDLWSLEIDWTEDPGGPGEESGSTDLLVLQPSVEGGYGWSVGTNWQLEVTLGLGVEINLDEDGRDVGEGLIGLLGCTLVAH